VHQNVPKRAVLKKN